MNSIEIFVRNGRTWRKQGDSWVKESPYSHDLWLAEDGEHSGRNAQFDNACATKALAANGAVICQGLAVLSILWAISK